MLQRNKTQRRGKEVQLVVGGSEWLLQEGDIQLRPEGRGRAGRTVGTASAQPWAGMNLASLKGLRGDFVSSGLCCSLAV